MSKLPEAFATLVCLDAECNYDLVFFDIFLSKALSYVTEL